MEGDPDLRTVYQIGIGGCLPLFSRHMIIGMGPDQPKNQSGVEVDLEEGWSLVWGSCT